MANYSREEFARAESIVSQLLEREADPERQGREFRAPSDNLVLSDVQWNMRQFNADVELLEYMGIDVPALRFENSIVPISLSYAASVAAPFYGLALFFPLRSRFFRRIERSEIFQYLRYILRELRDERDFVELGWMNPKEARSAFRSGAIDFVATRIGGMRFPYPIPIFLSLPQVLGGPSVQTSGCSFTVTTNSQGLRVFWSGAYYVVPNYFSHPTSPASSVLQSGTYIFGVDGGAYGNNIQWDKNAVISLPGSPQVHLNY